MDCLTFIVEMTRAIAWPLVAAGFLIVFRKPILKALERIASVKLPGGLEATFATKMEAAEEQAQELKPVSPDVADENDLEIAHLIAMAETSPRGAVIGAWLRVETAARGLGESSGIAINQRGAARAYFDLQRFLERKKLLEKPEINLFRELRLLRNKAAHATDFDLPSELAIQYVQLSDRLIDVLEAKRRALT